MSAPAADRAARDVTDTLLGFARTLRAGGVDASPDRAQCFVEAVGELDPTRRSDVYWAGRVTLCGGPDDVARYDSAFRAWFGGEVARLNNRPPQVQVLRPVPLESGDPPAGEGDDDEDRRLRTSTASRAEVLRQHDIARLDAADRDEVRRMIARIHPVGPTRPARRRQPAASGDLDVRRTVRAMLRRGGEPARLERAQVRPRPRRLVFLVDVSGSMQPYADSMLRFAHAAARRRPSTEVFTIGTRITRVTREMRLRDPGAALAAAAQAIPDWSGGTRLGELLKAFLDRWGQRGTARGAVVVVASDGWERGDATLLGEQMVRLHRLAYRVVWVNPHKGKSGFAPATAGMQAALPSVDDFVEGHSVSALEALADVISVGGRRA